MHFGLRIWKSVLGVFLCGFIYWARGYQGAPFYSCIALLQCMRTDRVDTLKISIQREVGTLIGAIYGIVMILLFNNVDGLWRYGIIALFIIPIINTAILFHQSNASYFACVVFLSIAINHLGDANPYVFVFNRWLDTTIGIVLAYIINHFTLIHKYDKATIFVMPLHEKLTSYTKYHLQRLLDQGIQVSFDFDGNVDEVQPELGKYALKVPIICNDGHTLYDVRAHQFIIKKEFTYKKAMDVYHRISHLDPHIFYIQEQTMMVSISKDDTYYYKTRTSPYLNYMHHPLPEGQPVLYFQCVDPTDEVLSLEGVCVKSMGNHTYKIYAPCDRRDFLYGVQWVDQKSQEASIRQIEKVSKTHFLQK